ncbi:MAG: protein-L-isoaspartate O-methyltransferase [Myxococcota bacterium]|nr:protein-L-isoaspartate O-methyltransferase [Myxococcota bacterium]
MRPDPGALREARRAYATEVRAAGSLRGEALVAALARVPREDFLGPGPWNEALGGGESRHTPSADPCHVYRDALFVLDERLGLNNGKPSFVCGLIDVLRIRPGEHAVHVGAGSGYYTALIAELVGSRGRVTAYEVHGELAKRARENLSRWPVVRVVHGDGIGAASGAGFDRADAVLVNAGVNEVPLRLVERLAPGGRLVLPLTVDAPRHGVGMVLRIEERGGEHEARFVGTVGIYPCAAARSVEAEIRLRRAFARGPREPGAVRSLRLDAHDETPSCWLHASGACLSQRELEG